jgi:hypothetical protein
MQNTFEHVKKSFTANADLSECVSVPSHGWTERERKAKEFTKTKDSNSVDDLGIILSDEDIFRIVAEYRSTYPNIKLDKHDDNHSLSV